MSSAKQEGEGNGVKMAAGKESLGQTLSDEELEAVPVAKRRPLDVSEPVTPSAQGTESSGFKFQPSSPIRCDFGDQHQAKGNNGNDAVTHSSSEDDFEHLNPPEENGETNGVAAENNDSAPTTPTKYAPHKRTADVAHGGATGIARTGSASPPSSPASKKKRWEDFLKEDDEKKKKREQEHGESKSNKPKELHGFNFVNVAAISLAVVIFAYLAASRFTEVSPSVSQAKPPTYTWKKANANFYNWTNTLGSEFPKQNRYY